MRAAWRVFLYGGLTSYRAMFRWLNPWILIPTFIASPVFQILLFVYVGRSAGLRDDSFFVIGNAVLYAAIPCLFAMGSTIAGERQQGTLTLLLASPARRVPVFLGRALPAILNGFGVAMVALALGALILRLPLPLRVWPALAVAVAVAAFACAGVGLFIASVALRVREDATLINIVFGLLLILAGVNVPVASLPGWLAAVSPWLPLTHSVAAAREVAAGASLGDVGTLLATEAGLGTAYVVVGLLVLAYQERQSRRLSTLDMY